VQARIIGVNEEKRQVRLSLRNVNLKPQEPELSPQQTTEDAGHEALTLREHLKGKGLV